jgi:hypothetical protein
MANSTIAFGGVLKTRADEERLVDALARASLPLTTEDVDDMTDEPPGDEVAEWYQARVDEAVDTGGTLVITSWVEDDDLEGDTQDLRDLFEEFAFEYRIFNGGGDGSQCLAGLRAKGFTAFVTCLVDPDREPLVRVHRVGSTGPINPRKMAEDAELALAILAHPLTPLSRAYEPE